MNKEIMKKIYFFLMIVVIAVIYLLSSQNSEISVHVSEKVAKVIKVEGNRWQGASTIPLMFGFDIRQWAHVLLFAVLGFFTMSYLRNWWKSSLICYCIALLDEIHQYFVPGRTARITDTLIDAVGFVSVIIIWLLIVRIINALKQKKCE